jgi:Cu/Zn superoxide dismutase
VFLTETRVVVVDVETEVENNANVIYLNEPRREWGGVGIHIHKKKKCLVSDTEGSGLLIEK